MDSNNKNHSLEDFVERHRADFDAHDPRPDLWAALEQQLAATRPVATAPLMRLAATTGLDANKETNAATDAASSALAAPTPARPNWFQRYGVAAALALLVFAAGASEAWKLNHPTPELVTATRPSTSGTAPETPDAALYQGGNPLALTATERTTGADSQLVRAVRGMEAYYTTQLARRQSELRQLNGPGMAAMTADWQHELVSLDSSYRQLKLELPHHPQPDAVLTAMNRNLQIRLDILDQQLHLGTATEADRNPNPNSNPNSGTYVLADSRRLPE